MKIIVTGSLGHISKPLTEELLSKGHNLTVISSKQNRQEDIEAIGASAAIGSVDDVHFLAETFKGADAIYCMIPPNFSEQDQIAYYRHVGKNYIDAIEQAGVKRVVELSSYGAHLEKGTGFIVGSHYNEEAFDNLKDVVVTHIRPGYFYYNLLNFASMIKHAGFIGANYGGDDRLLVVSPKDIASAIADEITQPATRNKIVYVASDDRSCSDIAKVLGEAIGKPGLEWKTLTNEQMQSGLEANGFAKALAAIFVELGEATHKGLLREDYDLNPPVMGKITLEEFAPEFAKTYNQ
ncbi:MAG: NAD(P)H-binding protein [Ginsengibacter sp.]